MEFTYTLRDVKTVQEVNNHKLIFFKDGSEPLDIDHFYSDVVPEIHDLEGIIDQERMRLRTLTNEQEIEEVLKSIDSFVSELKYLRDVREFIEQVDKGRSHATRRNDRAIAPNRLAKHGDVWIISFNGERSILKNYDGLDYIAFLLNRPGEEIQVQEIRRDPMPLPYAQPIDNDLLSQSRPAPPMKVDAKARAAVKKQLEDCTDRMREAELQSDVEECEKLREEANKLKKYLRDANSHPVVRDPSVKKQVDTVRKSMKKAIKEIAKNMPHLADHLTKSLQFGLQFKYQPNVPIVWKISRP